MRLSAEELIQPISEDLPCGEDLEYDPAFQQMESMMQSKPEQEFGDTIIPGEGPDWAGGICGYSLMRHLPIYTSRVWAPSVTHWNP